MRHRVVVSLGAVAPLALCMPCSADIHLSAVTKPIDGYEQFVSAIVNVFVVFDGTDWATNFLTGIGGLPGGQEGNVSVTGGEFFQHLLGGRTAPYTGDLAIIPGLWVDTFVTIGAKNFGPGGSVAVDATHLTPGFPTEDGVPRPGGTWGLTRLQVDDGVWFVTPDDAQGHVGNAANGPNTVLIGQFSVAAGAPAHANVLGELLVQGVNEGAALLDVFTFDAGIPAPAALGLLGIAGLIGTRSRRR